MDAAIIRQGELVGMGLMAYETTEEVGAVDHLLVNVAEAEVMGFACKAGGPLGGVLGKKQSISWDQLVKIGRDRIIIHTAVPASDMIENQLAAAQNVTGLEVWTDGGDCIGRVVDFCLEVETGKVQQFLFALNLREADRPEADRPAAAEGAETLETVEVFAIAPATIISAGRKRLMIAEEDARRAQPYDQRIAINPAKPERPLDWRPDQIPLPTDFNDVLQGAQSFAGKVTERVKQQAKKFGDEQLAQRRRPGQAQPDSLPEITEQLQAKTEQVKQQMQRRFEQARGQVEGKLNDSPVGRSISEKLGERLDKFVRPQSEEPEKPIDVEAFEVWEDD
ncbi:MAG: PRC-barrel domain-containing protein [Phormidesmis sp.]